MNKTVTDGTINIKPAQVTVMIYTEKKIDQPSSKPHVAGFTMIIPDTIDGDLGLKESDIEFVGAKDHAECANPDPYSHNRTNDSVQLYYSDFVNHNSDYDVRFQFDGDGVMMIVVDPSSHSPFFRVTLSNKEVTYNGEVQVFHPEVNGHSEVFTLAATPANVTDYAFDSERCTFYITIDPSRMSVSKKDVGTYTELYTLTPYVVSAKAVFYNTWTGDPLYRGKTFDVTNFINLFNVDGKRYGVLTIKPAPITVSVVERLDKNYGELDPDRSTWVTVTEGKLQGNDTIFDAVTVERAPGELARHRYQIRIGTKFSGGSYPGGEEVKKSPRSPLVEKKEEREAVEEYRPNWSEQVSDTITPEGGDTVGKKSGNYTVTITKDTGFLYIHPIEVVVAAE